jgi:hypothetical protein
MKPFLIILLSILAVHVSAGNDSAARKANMAFSHGEQLVFRVYYHALLTGSVTAGEAKLSVSQSPVPVGNSQTYHIVGEGKSKGAFNWFFKVNDRFETWMDKETLLPRKFVRRTREGNYSKDEDYIFNHQLRKVFSSRKQTNIPPDAQDLISAFYYARQLDFSKAKPGMQYDINFVFDDSVYTSRIRYFGKDTLNTKLGKIACLKFKPMVLTGNVFKDEYPMTLWISDDQNKLPIMAVSEVVVGSVRMELVEYKGLSNSFRAKLD